MHALVSSTSFGDTMHALVSSTSFGDTMHLVGSNSSIKLTPLWSRGTYLFDFFTIWMYKHCFLPRYLFFLMKWVKMHCSWPYNPYCCSLPSPVCLFHLTPAHLYKLDSLPIAWPPSSVLYYVSVSAFFWFVFWMDFMLMLLWLFLWREPALTSYTYRKPLNLTHITWFCLYGPWVVVLVLHDLCG